MSGGGSQPEAPDYNTLARIQSALGQSTAQQQTQANRVNQVNPYQSLTWSNDQTMQNAFDGDAYAAALQQHVDSGAEGPGPSKSDFYSMQPVDNWTQTVTMNPQMQQAFDTQMGAIPGMMQGAVDTLSQPFDLGGLSQVQGLDFSSLGQMPTLGQGDLSSLGQMPDAGFGAVQEIQDAMMGRLNPALTQGRDREVQRLKAQGITEGSPAWQAAMQSLNQKDVDANQQALLGAMGASGQLFNQGMQARQQGFNELMGMTNQNMQARQQGANELLQSRGATIDDRQRGLQELLLQRSQPLTELSQLMSGGNMQTPGFEGYTQATPWEAPDVMGAAQNQYSDDISRYNAQQQANSGLLGGLLGLGGTILSAGSGSILGGLLGL